MAAAAATRDVAALAPLGAPGSPLEQEWAALHERCAADPSSTPASCAPGPAPSAAAS